VKKHWSAWFAPRETADGPPPGPLAPGGGHDQAFERIILPHLDGAYGLARYLTRDPDLSQDIVQDAMLRAFRSFGQYRGGSPRAWLFAIVRNCCRTIQSSESGRIALVIQEDDLSDTSELELSNRQDYALNPEEEALRKTEVECVRSAIEAIPEPFREVIVLRDLEDLTYAEIAEAIGIPMGTVMSRLSRGRAMLARELLPTVSEAEQSRSAQ